MTDSSIIIIRYNLYIDYVHTWPFVIMSAFLIHFIIRLFYGVQWFFFIWRFISFKTNIYRFKIDIHVSNLNYIKNAVYMFVVYWCMYFVNSIQPIVVGFITNFFGLNSRRSDLLFFVTNVNSWKSYESMMWCTFFFLYILFLIFNFTNTTYFPYIMYDAF